MSGDFHKRVAEFRTLCEQNGIRPHALAAALDLGAGHGIQSVALADLGFKVSAIDFSAELLRELEHNRGTRSIKTIACDMRDFPSHVDGEIELIVCCGDTLPHLDSRDDVMTVFGNCYQSLNKGGKLLLSFRDYSTELTDTKRFIPVKSDTARILTCVLEYFPDKVRVTDLLHENDNGTWRQAASSYFKLRLSRDEVVRLLHDSGFESVVDIPAGMLTMLTKKV